jgi:N-acyl homoserine lactone hydrolase
MRMAAAFAGLMALCLSASAQSVTPPGLPPLPHLTSPRLYVLDCGTIISHEPERFGLSRQDVSDPDFSDPCFLVIHPKGILLFDTGLTDAQVGRPIYENKMGYEGQLKTTTLKGELANVGVTSAMITYLAISHSHWDHVGNGNAYAGSTWLARKAEYDVMFGSAANATAKSNYAALAHAKIQYIEGDHDVFGDGSVTILSTPGHTPGHQSLLVKLPKTGALLLSGDAVHFKDNWDNRRVPTGNFDKEKTLASMARMAEVMAKEKAQLWINHDKAQSDTLKHAPGFYD